MKTAAALLLCLSSAVLARADDVPTRIAPGPPSGGVVTLALEELWRAGGDDGDVLFGRLNDILRHPNGEIMVLDNQLCQVEVFGPDGAHRRTLGREGDGPGEVRQAIGLAFLPGDLVGIGSGFPGKMVTLTLDGAPVATRYPIGEPSDGNIGVMISLRSGPGLLAATGGRLVFDTPETSYTERFLAVSDADGTGEFTRILPRRTPIDPTGRLWDEAADYYFDGRWTIDPDGHILVPLERDRYVISVVDRGGRELRRFGRELAPRRRTAADKDRAGPIINVNGQRNDDAWEICDTDEAVGRIMVDPDTGDVWVLTPHGANDQPDGVLQTWDVFAPDGEFVREVIVPLGHEIREGFCYLVGDGLLVVQRGTGTSLVENDAATEPADAEEPEPLEVICYRIR
ncbi:hypothetical protein KDM41_02150 [bacterium]|nr:hypothetical protein [bacterium]